MPHAPLHRPHSRILQTSIPFLRRAPDGSGRLLCPLCNAAFEDNADVVIDDRLTHFLSQFETSERAAVVRTSRGELEYRRHRAASHAPTSSSCADARRRTDVEAPRACGLGAQDEENTVVPSRAGLPDPSSPAHPQRLQPAPEVKGGNSMPVVLMRRFVPSSGRECDPEEAGATRRARRDCAVPQPCNGARGEAVASFYAKLTNAGGGASSTSAAASEWLCEVCHERVRGSRVAHATSIAHQFAVNTKTIRKPTGIALPSGNVGFRMLRDTMGWREGEGLGRHGQGEVQPVPTRLKRDRTGLHVMGRESSTPLRVTHPATDVMGGPGDVAHWQGTKAERRTRKRLQRKRQAYIARCKELIIQRQLHDEAHGL
eukprot:CAMPEP_0185181766 /NCGR_PEP_ID=MMETSP1140-20130426/853_1 /TAXON_ID=298111 /ORGANISM="Pavlova sp., Strain CCMP459" /LENGTH=371 /DNA_ID=CAMNT_0027747657 /DNA_START=136 /DNA_END=1252 /DNA_ORIENTATION=+